MSETMFPTYNPIPRFLGYPVAQLFSFPSPVRSPSSPETSPRARAGYPSSPPGAGSVRSRTLHKIPWHPVWHPPRHHNIRKPLSASAPSAERNAAMPCRFPFPVGVGPPPAGKGAGSAKRSPAENPAVSSAAPPG